MVKTTKERSNHGTGSVSILLWEAYINITGITGKFQRQINELQVYCLHKNMYGCSVMGWSVEQTNLAEHLAIIMKNASSFYFHVLSHVGTNISLWTRKHFSEDCMPSAYIATCMHVYHCDQNIVIILQPTKTSELHIALTVQTILWFFLIFSQRSWSVET